MNIVLIPSIKVTPNQQVSPQVCNLLLVLCTQRIPFFLREESPSLSPHSVRLQSAKPSGKEGISLYELGRILGCVGKAGFVLAFLSPSNHKHRSFWSAGFGIAEGGLGDVPEQWHISSLLNHRAISHMTNWLSLPSPLERTLWLKEPRA